VGLCEWKSEETILVENPEGEVWCEGRSRVSGPDALTMVGPVDGFKVAFQTSISIGGLNLSLRLGD
jgi:hypothetical protein